MSITDKTRRINDIFAKLIQCHERGILTKEDMEVLEYILYQHTGKLREPYAELIYHDEYGMDQSYRAQPIKVRDEGLMTVETYTIEVGHRRD